MVTGHVIECKNCGAKNELPDDVKRWIIRLYEAATGKLLLPGPHRWMHKRVVLTPLMGDLALCGAVQVSGEPQALRWKPVTCPRCLARRGNQRQREAREREAR